ncbi:MAG: REP-associated tyrosine transposase [Pseudomonadota bacterium]|jgi:putative transposase
MARDQDRGYRALRRGRHSEAGRIYFVSTVCRGRRRFFADWDVARTVCAQHAAPDAFLDAEALAWVLMPDHWHGLIALNDSASLPEVMQHFKARSAKAANRTLGRSGALWQGGFHDRALRHDDDLRAAARYLIANPIRAGLARRTGDYPYWDCIWL